MKVKIDVPYESGREYFIVVLPYFLMSQSELVDGDYIIIKGKQDYPAMVLSAPKSDRIIKGLRMSKILQSLLEVKVGDRIELKKTDIKPAKSVFLRPLNINNIKVEFGGSILENHREKNVLSEWLCPEYKLRFKDFPVWKDMSLFYKDAILVKIKSCTFFEDITDSDFTTTLLVTNTIPKGLVLIDDKTKIELDVEINVKTE